MKRKYIMLAGATQCGKTTLAQFIEKRSLPKVRTMEPVYREKTMECPGAYVENAGLYRHLIAAAQDAACILLLLDASAKMDFYSPGFACAFTRPVAGVITKTDVCPENVDFCRKRLQLAGVNGPIFLSDGSEAGSQGLNALLSQYMERI